MNLKNMVRTVSVLMVGFLIMLFMNGFSFQSIMQGLYAPNIKETRIHSAALNKNQKVNIYLPPGYTEKEKYPVLYLFHGKDGNEKSWFNGFFGISAAKIDRTADRLIKKAIVKPLIIVSPMIDNSYGVNTSETSKHVADHDEGLYENFIIEELIPYIDSHYSTEQDKRNRFIGGISMGGFTALHLALAYPDLFSKVGGHSAAIRMDADAGSGIAWMFNNGNIRNEIDPLFQADSARDGDISVYIDYGDMDHEWLKEGNKALFEKLKDKNIDVSYVIGHGGHDYKYWSSQTEKYLLFYNPAR